MNLLLDTHALIWFLENDSRLSRKARLAIESSRHTKFVSLVSGWEMAIKSGLGKLTLPIRFEELFPGKLEFLGFQLLPLVPGHLHGLVNLPDHHRDPFDRLLIAQASHERMPLISADPHFESYRIPLLW